MRTPIVIWWVWLAFALVNVADLAVQWHHRSGLVIGAIIATCTGIAYACALRPRMIADNAALTVHNPVRDATVPWGSISAIDVGEAVQVHFTAKDGTEKVLPSWAMFSSSRSKLKAQQRAAKQAAQLTKMSPSYQRLPAEARQAMARSTAELVAEQLDDRAARARKAGADAGQPTMTWAWWSIAAMAVPAAATVLLLLVR